MAATSELLTRFAAGAPATRTYYPTTRQGNPSIRKLPHHKPRPPLTNDPTANLYWNGPYAHVQRSYQASVMLWWKSGLMFGGPTFWNTLASLYPITTYNGIAKTTTGFRWFDWFQRKSLNFFGYNEGPWDPTPTYDGPLPPYTPIPYPDYPRLPWAPPAIPHAFLLDHATPGNIFLTIADGPFTHGMHFTAYAATTPPGINTPKLPHHQAVLTEGKFPPATPIAYTLQFPLSQLYWDGNPGHAITVGMIYMDDLTHSISPTRWQTLLT